jgi:carboxypeptidase family protein/TonB-dependent receptor-like protein
MSLRFTPPLWVQVGKAAEVLGVTLGVLLMCLPLFSQTNFGRILGIVTDQSGGVIPDATVTIVDTQRGVARTLTTNEVGEHNAPTLIPGTYMVRVEAKGFKKLERENVVLEVGKDVQVDVTVQPGERTETVTVTGSIPLVQTTNDTLGGTLDNADINDMPLNGRNYQSLMGLRPGVMLQPGGGPWTQSTNNIRPDETVWMVDGVINANFFDARPIAGMPSPLTDGATILPIDAIQEFNIMENPKAEYGWRPGAVVNVGIRSGTNNLHGSAYAFGRDGAWDARNIFNPGLTNGTCVANPDLPPVCNKLPTELKQFGSVVGGPIKKDKLFFFAGYEGLRSFIGNAFRGTVPETASQANVGAFGPAGDPKNSTVDAIRALQAANLPVSPVSLALLGCPSGALTTASTCTGGYIQGAAANTTGYLSAFPNVNTSDNGVAKADARINSQHLVNGMLFTSTYDGLGNDSGAVNQAWRSAIWIRAWTATGNWIWTPSSRLVNEVRVSYNRMSLQFLSADITKFANGTDYPLNTGITSVGGFPFVIITGFYALGTSHRTELAPNPYYDLQESVSYLRGKHTFKFGGEFTPIEADSNVHPTQGRISFGSKGGRTPGLTDCSGGVSCPLEDFFAGNPAGGRQLIGNPKIKMTWRSLAGFVQDDWRVTPKFMLNLGLRYSYVSPIKEVNNLLGNFDPALGMVQQGQPSVGDSLWKSDRNNFSPRVGFAWDVTGKGTTVVRAGASIIYSIFTPANFLANSLFRTSIAAVPTGADLVTCPAATCGNSSSSTFGTPVTTPGSGTIHLGNIGFPSSRLAWNGVVFPSTGGNVQCGDGVTLPSGATDPSPCDLMGVDPNLRYPYLTNWNLSVQHAFTKNLSLEVGYVGNHGARLTSVLDINQPVLGAGYCLNSPLTSAQLAGACNPASPDSGIIGLAELQARPYAARFPYLGFIDQVSNDGRSNYHSLQVTLTKRVSHGLSFTAGYTYGHGLDNGSLSRNGGFPQDSMNPGAEYASSDFDVRHRFTFTGTYELPGKKGFGQLLEGWKINSIVTLQSGQPWLVNDGGNDGGNDFSGIGDLADRWDFFGNTSDFKSGANSIPFCSGFDGTLNPAQANVACSIQSGISGIVTALPASLGSECIAAAPDAGTLAVGGCYVSGSSVMVPPKLGTFGTMGRNIFRDSGFKNWDFSVFKSFTFKERFGAEFRLELFNIFNHPNIANPYGASNGSGLGNNASASSSFGCGCATPDYAAANPLVGSGSSRAMQLGLKLTF